MTVLGLKSWPVTWPDPVVECSESQSWPATWPCCFWPVTWAGLTPLLNALKQILWRHNMTMNALNHSLDLRPDPVVSDQWTGPARHHCWMHLNKYFEDVIRLCYIWEVQHTNWPITRPSPNWAIWWPVSNCVVTTGVSMSRDRSMRHLLTAPKCR